MLVINESAAGHLDLQGAHFDGSLELHFEVAVTNWVDAGSSRTQLHLRIRKYRLEEAMSA